MHRFAAILLAACFAALGTGVLRYAHDAAHAYADAHGSDGAVHAPDHDHVPPHHDETNCEVHALLNAPIVGPGVVPALVLLGLFVAFLTLLAPRPVRARVLARIDCRGPPSSSF